MEHTPSQRARGPAGLMALGVLMIVAGVSVLAWLIYIGNSAAPGGRCSAWAWRARR
jgi:hypothetical protein